MDLAAAVAGLVAALEAADIRATDDPRDLNPPCVHVRPPEIAWEFKPGSFTATWTLWCVVPDVGRHMALQALSALIADTQEALDWRAVSARPDDVTLTDATTAPMYVLTFDERICN